MALTADISEAVWKHCYRNALLAGLPKSVQDEHDWPIFETYPARLQLVTYCRCGWTSLQNISPMTWASLDEQSLRPLIEPYIRHMHDVRSELSPTLADLTDWGWFDPEVW